MKSKLLKYAESSDIMNITIKYGRERFSFNLNEELRINENIINSQIKDQPTSYAFLTMLQQKLIKLAKDKEFELQKIYARQLESLRGGKDPSTGRPPSKDSCEVIILASDEYQEKAKELVLIESNANTIRRAVEAFEQRKDILQTLSANLRKEK